MKRTALQLEAERRLSKEEGVEVAWSMVEQAMDPEDHEVTLAEAKYWLERYYSLVKRDTVTPFTINNGPYELDNRDLCFCYCGCRGRTWGYVRDWSRSREGKVEVVEAHSGQGVDGHETRAMATNDVARK
ncbi:hypothetical protein [Amycolatopsis samaneae]|uniref:Uncharacterized protein n=1 Tax=Amycolatopsis samaneae TaxID=664691 RepID=A0ABW5GU95_9PSEU